MSKPRNPYGHTRSRYTSSRVRDYLIATGRSQAWLAREMGWNARHVNEVLLGRQVITDQFVDAVCRVLAMPAFLLFDADELLDGKPGDKPASKKAEHAIA